MKPTDMCVPVSTFRQALHLAREQMEAAAFLGVEHLVSLPKPVLDVHMELAALHASLAEFDVQEQHLRRVLSREGRTIAHSLSDAPHLALLDWGSSTTAEAAAGHDDLRRSLQGNPSLLKLRTTSGMRSEQLPLGQ